MEAITAKECQEDFDYDSLETLGDSFLKYVASQQLFKTYQNHREGPLTEERKKMISNDALFDYGCSHKLPVCFFPLIFVVITFNEPGINYLL